jgi:sulfide:quinone oxidoreductase
MNVKKVTPNYFVSAQINPSDVSAVAAAGIRTIINNRPDYETADQPETQAIADAAIAAGLDFLHIPVSSKSISDENIRDFAVACESAQEPVLAYCRSGMRSTSLWALIAVGSQDIDTVIATAKDAGYDLDKMRQWLQSRAGT